MNIPKSVGFVGLVSIPLMLGAASAAGLESESNYTRLSLNGVGHDSQPTSFVEIRASTSTWSRRPSGAMEENAATMKSLRARLRSMGVAEDDFRTQSFQFRKQRDPDDRSGDRADGYSAVHALSVIVRDPDKAGAVMDALVKAGADGLSVNSGYGYGRSNDVKPESEKRARKAAIKDAQDKANDYAAALGMKIRRIVEIRDGSAYAMNRPQARAAAYNAAITQVDTRDQLVQASVSVVIELE